MAAVCGEWPLPFDEETGLVVGRLERAEAALVDIGESQEESID